MVPAKHVVALQQAKEATAIGDRSFMDRPVFAWLALSSALAGCALSYAVVTEHASEHPQKEPKIEQALVAALPKLVR
jgi:hypothetical protein